jgi:hypothetical protein
MERFNSFASDQIVITKRQASMMMASMLLFCLFVFIVGFFLGKRAAIDDFSGKVSKQALHDQIDFLLTTQSLQSSQDEAVINSSNTDFSSSSFNEPFDTPIITLQPEKTVASAIFTQDTITTPATITAPVEKQDSIISKDPIVVAQAAKSQYAQLIGFGTKKSAQSFVARLKKHNVPVILKTVISKTSSGKERVWYQAITPTYQSTQELQEQVAKVKRLEHIRDKDIKIVYAR